MLDFRPIHLLAVNPNYVFRLNRHILKLQRQPIATKYRTLHLCSQKFVIASLTLLGGAPPVIPPVYEQKSVGFPDKSGNQPRDFHLLHGVV